MDEHELQLNDEITPEVKSSSGKKILGGFGCGCLVIVLVLAGLTYWAYRHFTSYVRGYEEQGYTLVQGQMIQSSSAKTGSFVYFGQKVTVGDVNGNVAAQCQQITFEGTITGDVNLLCQQVTIAETAVILGNIHAEDVQQLVIKGEVRGEITGDIQQLVNPNQKQE
jgi:hypothetical protein